MLFERKTNLISQRSFEEDVNRFHDSSKQMAHLQWREALLFEMVIDWTGNQASFHVLRRLNVLSAFYNQDEQKDQSIFQSKDMLITWIWDNMFSGNAVWERCLMSTAEKHQGPNCKCQAVKNHQCLKRTGLKKTLHTAAQKCVWACDWHRIHKSNIHTGLVLPGDL